MNARRAFTLIELQVVIAIIAITPKSAHVTARNNLFFDSHVAAKKAGGWETF